MIDENRVAGCPHSELAVGWALHALEPAEESLVAVHLMDCQACTQIVSETERVGASLGLSIPQAIPSAGLEQRILAVVNATAVAPVIPLTQRGVRTEVGARARSRVLAAAAAVVLIAMSVTLGIRVVQLDGERDRAINQLTDLSEVMQGVADPASDLVPLATEDGRSVGMVVAVRDQITLVANDLPGNRTADETYVLWGLVGATPRALAPFDVASDATTLRHVNSVPGAGEFTGYAVSLEQGRHAPAAPTAVKASGLVES
ncbi:MAG: hypothetical protein ACT4NY_20100 [Pseudonocardiales bacterium]